jgi:hypothetical protein
MKLSPLQQLPLIKFIPIIYYITVLRKQMEYYRHEYKKDSYHRDHQEADFIRP